MAEAIGTEGLTKRIRREGEDGERTRNAQRRWRRLAGFQNLGQKSGQTALHRASVRTTTLARRSAVTARLPSLSCRGAAAATFDTSQRRAAETAALQNMDTSSTTVATTRTTL